MTNYQKRQYATLLKESFSIVQQALRMSEMYNGGVDSWDTSLNGSQFFHTYIAEYVKYTDEYTTAELKRKVNRKNLNGSSYYGTTYTGGNAYHFTLLNGVMITTNLNSSGEKGMWVGIDVNGISKPNTIGKDTFLFFLSASDGFQPLGGKGTPASWSYGGYDRAKIKGTNTNSCNKSKTGYWCAALIIQDGWIMADDYPW